MTMRILTESERFDFYYSYLINDFHKNEIKPFNIMERLVKQGKYICYGFFDDKIPLGYAYFIKSKCNKYFLLDYFAVLTAYRSIGLGSKFINEINNKFMEDSSVLIAEIENPDYINDEKNKEDSIRRINFYLRNGFRQSNILSQAFSCEYIIFTLSTEEQNDNELYEDVRKIYLDIFGKDLFNRQIYVRLSEK